MAEHFLFELLHRIKAVLRAALSFFSAEKLGSENDQANQKWNDEQCNDFWIKFRAVTPFDNSVKNFAFKSIKNTSTEKIFAAHGIGA